MAFMAPVLLLVLVGAWDFSRLAKEHNRLTYAVGVGGQFGMMFPNDTAAIEQMVLGELGPVADQATVTLSTFCECPGSGTPVGCGGTCAGFSGPAMFMSIQADSQIETLWQYPFMANPIGISRQMVIRIL